jgi:hypothetical protein
MNEKEQHEPIGWVIRTGTWRDLIRRIPRPVLALHPTTLFSVLVHGSGFALPIAGGQKPAIGFFATRFVAACNVREAERLALSAIERDWQRKGLHHAAGRTASLAVEEISELSERFRLRSGSGFTFYNDANDAEHGTV